MIILDRTFIDPQAIARTFTVEYRPDLLGGVNVIHGKGYAIDEAGWQDEFYREEAPDRKGNGNPAGPYFVWDNRAPCEIRIWLRTRNR